MDSNILKITEQGRSPIVNALLEKLEQSDVAMEALLHQNKEVILNDLVNIQLS